MGLKLKPLDQQVMVITGASSGIGLATARMAAKRGAKLVLAARNEEALRQLVMEIRDQGGEAVYVVADVSEQAEVREIARTAEREFGGFDTWVNNAGVGVFGYITDVPLEDHRKVVEVNFWGAVYGSLEAVERLREHGGALINVGSVGSDRALPMQGMYSAAKHGIKGFTDALRMELCAQKAPISVSLIKPASIDTPFPQHGRNYTDKEPSIPPPLYSPNIVAEAILHCAEHPKRDVIIGGVGKMISVLGEYFPGLGDRWMSRKHFRLMMQAPREPIDPRGALDEPTFGMQERGEFSPLVLENSAYTKSVLHPVITGALVLLAGVAVAAAVRSSQVGRRSDG
jgi:short-subunit dehydrogenase